MKTVKYIVEIDMPEGYTILPKDIKHFIHNNLMFYEFYDSINIRVRKETADEISKE